MRYFVPAILFFLVLSCKDDKTNPGADTGSSADRLVNALTEKVNTHPDSNQYRITLIDALDSLGRYKEAVAQMRILLKKDSTNNSFWSRNGLLLERSGDTTAAIESYIRSLSIYPDPNNQLYLANLMAERKDQRALLLVNNVAKEKFDRETLANCDFIAGVYHARTGNRQMAEQLFNRSISNNIKFMEAYIEKGLLYFDQGKFADALKIFQAAGDVDPTYADAFYYQARCYESMGKTQEAINMYHQSLRLDPSLKEATRALARLGAQAG